MTIRRKVITLLGGVTWRKDQREEGPAARVVGNVNPAAMRFHNLAHDREPQSGPHGFVSCLTAPEAIEDVSTILFRNAFSAIGDGHAAVGMHGDDDLAARRRVNNRILDDVADR